MNHDEFMKLRAAAYKAAEDHKRDMQTDPKYRRTVEEIEARSRRFPLLPENVRAIARALDSDGFNVKAVHKETQNTDAMIELGDKFVIHITPKGALLNGYEGDGDDSSVIALGSFSIYSLLASALHRHINAAH